jgi:hypothetical protein
MFGYQRDAGKYFVFFLGIGLTLLIGESFGLMFAMMTPTADLAVIFMSIVLILLLSLTGFLAQDTPTYYVWIEKINFMRYAHQRPMSLPSLQVCHCSCLWVQSTVIFLFPACIGLICNISTFRPAYALHLSALKNAEWGVRDM